LNDFFSPLALTEKIQVGFADTNVFVDAERFGKVFDIAFGDFVLGKRWRFNGPVILAGFQRISGAKI